MAAAEQSVITAQGSGNGPSGGPVPPSQDLAQRAKDAAAIPGLSPDPAAAFSREPAAFADRVALWEAYWRERLPAQRNALALAYFPLAGLLAATLAPRYGVLDGDDLASAGAAKLLQAIERARPGMPGQAERYLRICMRMAMIATIQGNDPLCPTHRRAVRAVEEGARQLGQASGSAPSDVEIAGRLGMPERTVWELRLAAQAARSVSGSDIDWRDRREENPAVQVQRRDELAHALSGLSRAQRLLLALHYGEGLALHEIAPVLGCTCLGAKKIHAAAWELLHARFPDIGRRRTIHPSAPRRARAIDPEALRAALIRAAASSGELSAREALVLKLRHGMDAEYAGQRLSLRAAGLVLGLSAERVRFIEAAALAKLPAALWGPQTAAGISDAA